MIDPNDLREAAADLDGEDLEGAVLARLSWRLRHGFKTCACCGRALPVAAFGRDASRRDGLEVRCRPCRRSSANV